MVVHIKNRKSGETAFGPYLSMSTARRGFASRGLDASEYMFDDDRWRDRECGRDNLIDLAQFGLLPIEDHYLHISKKDEGADALMVSFTLNEAKGRADRQESGRKIGRYLKEFFPALSDDEITSLSGSINGRYNQNAVKFARTRQEIRDAYMNSRDHCSSCMNYRIDQYSSMNYEKNVYPVEAYHGPDLAIAYTQDKQGRVNARAIVWPEKKIHGRIYGGNPDKMRRQLEDLGFREGRMDDARMSAIEIGRSGREVYYAMPYIDGHNQYVSFDGEYFRIGSNHADTTSTGTSGYVTLTQYMCVLSNQRIPASQVQTCRDGTGSTVYYDINLIGSDVYNEQMAMHEGRRHWMGGPDDTYHTAVDGVRFPSYLTGSTYSQCSFDQKYYLTSEIINGVHFSNLIKHYVRCEMTGTLMRKDDRYACYHMEHGAYWSRSAFRKWGQTGPNGERISTIHNIETQAEAA